VSSSGNLINVARPYGYRKSAFGVIGMSYPTGPIREVLKAGASTEKCLARSQSCPRYRRPAAAINDAPEGAKAMNRSAPKHVTLNNCVEHFLETRIDQDAQAPQVKARYWQLIALQIASARRTLGQKIFKEAVWMAGGLPLSVPMLNIGAQLKGIRHWLKTSDFQNPRKPKQFIQWFNAMCKSQNAAAATVSPSQLPLTTFLSNHSGLFPCLINARPASS